MVSIMSRDGFNAMTSKNLASIMRYHYSKSPIVFVRIREYANNRGCDCVVRYLDGSKCETEWCSYAVCKLWFAGKRSISNKATILHVEHNLDYDILTIDTDGYRQAINSFIND
jgi:hypothetical protein